MSRVTFRGTCDGVAWQRQLRDKYLGDGTPPVPHVDVGRALVRPVSRALAEQIILRYEWLGTMTRTSWHYGIFFGAYCGGVCCVGKASVLPCKHAHLTYGIEPDELRVLARGACVHWAPPGANSRLVAWTARLAAREAGGKVLLAFSDTEAGEIGTIYQACGWVYIGQAASGRRELVAPNGRVYNYSRILKFPELQGLSTPERRAFLLANGWREQKHNPKHRYVCVLDRADAALVARVEALRKPYPKRASEASG